MWQNAQGPASPGPAPPVQTLKESLDEAWSGILHTPTLVGSLQHIHHWNDRLNELRDHDMLDNPSNPPTTHAAPVDKRKKIFPTPSEVAFMQATKELPQTQIDPLLFAVHHRKFKPDEVRWNSAKSMFRFLTKNIRNTAKLEVEEDEYESCKYNHPKLCFS